MLVDVVDGGCEVVAVSVSHAAKRIAAQATAIGAGRILSCPMYE
jgi:hypothetical protein